MNITIKFDDREVTKKLNNLASSVKSFKDPLEDIGDDLKSYYGKDVFDSQGKEIQGSKWKALTPATIKARQLRIGHYANTPIATNKILVWTGNLKNSITKKATAFKLVISNKADYFKHLQGERNMFGINKKVTNIVVSRLEKYIKTAINR